MASTDHTGGTDTGGTDTGGTDTYRSRVAMIGPQDARWMLGEGPELSVRATRGLVRQMCSGTFDLEAAPVILRRDPAESVVYGRRVLWAVLRSGALVRVRIRYE
jgi:hypothetical protein